MRSVVALALALLAGASARAGEWADVRLPATFCGEAVAPQEGSLHPVPLGAECEPAPVADRYDTRSDGLSEPEVVVHPKLVRDGWTFDGALALGFWKDAPNEFGAATGLVGSLAAVADDSSFLRIAYRPSGWNSEHGVSLALFPFSSDRLHLGFSHELAWAGDAMLPRSLPAPGVPAVRLGVRGRAFDAFVAAKWTTALDKSTNAIRPIGALLGGGGIDLPLSLRVDANGGFLYQGTNPRTDVLGQPVETFGGSLQLSWTHGRDVARTSDVTFVTDDPTSPGHSLEPRHARSGMAAFVAASVTWLGQRLDDSAHPGATTIQPARSADVRARVEAGALRIDATAMVRDLSSVLEEVPGFVPYEAIANATVAPQTLFTVRADYHFERLRLTPGAEVGVESPATFTGRLPPEFVGSVPSEHRPRGTTVALQNVGDLDLFPPCVDADDDCGARARWGFAAFAREDLVEGRLVAYVELHDRIDPNVSTLVRSSSGSSYERVRLSVNDLGGRLGLVAAF